MPGRPGPDRETWTFKALGDFKFFSKSPKAFRISLHINPWVPVEETKNRMPGRPEPGREMWTLKAFKGFNPSAVAGSQLCCAVANYVAMIKFNLPLLLYLV